MLAYNRRASSAIRVGDCYYNILQLWILNAYIYIYTQYYRAEKKASNLASNALGEKRMLYLLFIAPCTKVVHSIFLYLQFFSRYYLLVLVNFTGGV
jgi:hypothetical protein